MFTLHSSRESSAVCPHCEHVATGPDQIAAGHALVAHLNFTHDQPPALDLEGH